MTGDRRTGIHLSVPAIVMLALSALGSGMLFAVADAPQAPQALSVPAIGVSEPPENTDAQMELGAAVREVAQPTLPGGKLPQYQLTPRRRLVETTDQIENASVRFLLALPAEPLLIEAKFTIDGEAFRKQRERRIAETLQAALQPPPEPPDPPERQFDPSAPLVAEKPGSAAEAGDSPDLRSYRSADSHVEKLRRYIASIGREPTLREVRWFFINRLDGPTLLLLKDSFQAFRSDETPVFHVLDRNRDDAISREEIDQAVESFRDCDLNRNEVVDYLEINEAASDPRLRSYPLTNTSALIHPLPAEADAAEVYAALLARYDSQQKPARSLPERFDANVNGQWEPKELETLHAMPADITLTVNFSSHAPSDSALSVSEETLKRLAALQLRAEVVNSSIVLHRPDCELWLSAAQTIAGDQISVGAVSDGYPMLPVLDPNEDGRFTIRELRGLAGSLKQFDANGDGRIQKQELRPTIRVSFGLGPTVHQALAGMRTVHPPGAPPKTGPGWFVRMDRNGDNDLSRGEFPGTDAQFQQLDADKDELISVEEALESERQNSSSQPEAETSTPPETENNNNTPSDGTPADSDN